VFENNGLSVLYVGRHIKEPYLDVKGSVSYEMGACYNVSVSCTSNGMVTQVRTSKLFNGKIYSKTRPHSCVMDVRYIYSTVVVLFRYFITVRT
jgi:hypothetical protein